MYKVLLCILKRSCPRTFGLLFDLCSFVPKHLASQYIRHVIIQPYVTRSVCNAFCLFQENPSFFVLGQKGRRRKALFILLYVEIRERKQKTHVSRNLSLFLEENKQRRKRCALKIRSSLGPMVMTSSSICLLLFIFLFTVASKKDFISSSSDPGNV